MLLVMAILVVFGSFGVGGFIGFRETMFVRENVEIIKQDILLAQEQATLVKRDWSDNWLYGVGIDFSGITGEGTTYNMIKWCSPFSDFGNTITRSKLLGWDPSTDIGTTVTKAVLGASDENLYALLPCNDTCTSCYQSFDCTWSQYLYGCCTCSPYTSTSCVQDSVCCEQVVTQQCVNYDVIDCCSLDGECDSLEASCNPAYPSCCELSPSDEACDSELPPVDDPPTEDPGTTYATAFINGYLPADSDTYTTSCILGTTSIVEFKGEAADRFVDAGNVSLIGYNDEYPIQYLVFEAVTGKAFLYDSAGRPVNYNSSGGILSYDGDKVLDILITRDRSSKFDLLSVYPSSGTVVHHVYSNDDLATDGDTDTITVNGKQYKRFNVLDDINSYRD